MKTLILLPFLVWRITSLLVHEEGPAGVFDKFRHLIGIRYDEYANKYGKNIIADAFSCFWCASIWVSAVVWLIYYLAPETTFWLGAPFAISALSILVEKVLNYGEG